MILRGFCGLEDSAAVSLAHAIEAAASWPLSQLNSPADEPNPPQPLSLRPSKSGRVHRCNSRSLAKFQTSAQSDPSAFPSHSARYHAVRAGKATVPAQRRAAAGRALALLGDAVKAGYADRSTLAGDPDLAPLRQEAGFQALLHRLAQ